MSNPITAKIRALAVTFLAALSLGVASQSIAPTEAEAMPRAGTCSGEEARWHYQLDRYEYYLARNKDSLAEAYLRAAYARAERAAAAGCDWAERVVGLSDGPRPLP